MKKIILTDADGVLVNWNKAFSEFILSKGYKQLPDTDEEYSLAARYGISAKESKDLVKEFNESENIAYLQPFADSVKYVKKLADLGFKFIVISSLSDSPAAKEYRTKNLLNIFGDVFINIVCIETGANKLNTLMSWSDTGFYWIEDHTNQAEAGYEAGLKPILINHSYNEQYETNLFPKVSIQHPWKEIFGIISDRYNLNNI